MQEDILKSRPTDYYNVQTELDVETKETGLKMQEYDKINKLL